MVERLQGMFRQLFPSAPWPPAVTAAGGTRHRHHLPRAAPFLRAGRRPSRYRDPAAVWALRPTTSVPGLYLTGQDIVAPGIISAMWSGLMTVRQVEGISLWSTLRGRDVHHTLP